VAQHVACQPRQRAIGGPVTKNEQKRIWLVGGLVWLVLILPAAGCGSGAPEQRVGTVVGELVQFGLNNHVCVEGEVGTCGTGEVTTCTGDCVTPRLEGQSCVNLACHNKSVCAKDSDGTGRASTSCVYDGSGWTCRSFDATSNPGMALYNECDPTDSWHPCPADSWCKDVGTCNNVTLGSTDHMCDFYQTHGNLCDGDFTDSGCALCAPGTHCHWENIGFEGFTGRCRKPCTSADDCPCEDDGQQEHICYEDGYCHKCRQEGESCDESYVCCDSSMKCGPAGKCCRDIGVTCSVDDQCCRQAGETCIDAVCAKCRKKDQPCTESADCCKGACVEGKCTPKCELMKGDPCTPDGVEGPCAEGAKWECDSNYDPVCKQAVFGDTETCNNVDDDCDGVIDNDVTTFNNGSTCSVSPGECQTGFSTTGHKTCSGGVVGCEATPWEDYCNACGDNGSGNCGVCTGNVCNIGDCAPNLRCNQTTWTCEPVSTTLPGCNPQGPGYTPKCWKFDDVGTGETTCCGECLP